jgi:hypothetical protein
VLSSRTARTRIVAADFPLHTPSAALGSVFGDEVSERGVVVREQFGRLATLIGFATLLGIAVFVVAMPPPKEDNSVQALLGTKSEDVVEKAASFASVRP